MASTKPVAMRLRPHVADQLKQLADDKGFAVSALVTMWISDAWADRPTPKAEKPEDKPLRTLRDVLTTVQFWPEGIGRGTPEEVHVDDPRLPDNIAKARIAAAPSPFVDNRPPPDMLAMDASIDMNGPECSFDDP